MELEPQQADESNSKVRESYSATVHVLFIFSNNSDNVALPQSRRGMAGCSGTFLLAVSAAVLGGAFQFGFAIG